MLLLPISSNLYNTFKTLAETKRMIFMAGLPGTGKSLLIQQLALIAAQTGRKIHLLQYTLSREPFETEQNLAKYPEIEGFTAPAIRKAVGLWSRGAVVQWHKQHPDPEHLLIGELPLIGNRLTELIKVYRDEAEPLLTDENTLFVVPVPSWEVREVIEERRAQTLANPQNKQETMEAQPNVLQALWQEVNTVARRVGLTKVGDQAPYNPYIYGGVYEALLKHRNTQMLLIEQVLQPTHSVYEMEIVEGQIQASTTEVNHFIEQVEHSYTARELQQAVNQWHALITDNPQMPDPGPELRLPLPEDLSKVSHNVALTTEQIGAIRDIIALPLSAAPADAVETVDRALEALSPSNQPATVLADVDKFDIYDSYFNVTRSNEDASLLFLIGLLQAYRNIMEDLQNPPQTLTVVEMPMLRIALESTLQQFVNV
ncbi:MAG: hypothetical protein AAF485_26305 [Chloroflexota bacterium]